MPSFASMVFAPLFELATQLGLVGCHEPVHRWRGPTPRAAVETMAAMQMVDVHLPTTDGRHLVLSRYTQPDPAHKLLLQRLKLTLPEQPPPKMSAVADTRREAPAAALV